MIQNFYAIERGLNAEDCKLLFFSFFTVIHMRFFLFHSDNPYQLE